MRVLVACEFSGRVRDAFIHRGHDAMSCDILKTDAPGPHYKGDVRDIIADEWDLMIAHPPCTHLAVSGARSYRPPDFGSGGFCFKRTPTVARLALYQPIPARRRWLPAR